MIGTQQLLLGACERTFSRLHFHCVTRTILNLLAICDWHMCTFSQQFSQNFHLANNHQIQMDEAKEAIALSFIEI